MNVPPAFRDLLEKHAARTMCRRPRAVVAAYDQDFMRNAKAFAELGRANRGLAVVLQLGYEHETPELAERLAGAVRGFLEAVPDARTVVLCNSKAEVSALGSRGVETRLANQNSFLDERRYRPLGGRERPYDAAYVARLTPCKRHQLVPPEMAPRLLLLGYGTKIYESEMAYAEMARTRYAAARQVATFSGAGLSGWLAQAKCGLMLSEREGASFASSEYLLCGLPVVDTPAPGGRDALYPAEFVRSVEADEKSVGEGIEYWTENRPDPREVRAAWLEKARPHRAAWRELMRELTGRTPGRPPHKLGLRTPHPGTVHSLGIAAYLWAKGVWER